MYRYEQEKENLANMKKNPYYMERPLHEWLNPDKKYVSLLGSMSHTYGNALAFIENWAINLFPENLFKTIHVNSKIAHRQIKDTNHEFIKKMKPMIIFRPRIGGPDEDRFLKGTPIIERQNDLYSTWGNTNLQDFFIDREKNVNIKYQLNRSVMYVDVICIFSTLMQQIDYFHYLQNAIRINIPFNINTFFESYIPQEMLSIVSDLTGVPLYDPDQSTRTFLKYMEGKSTNPITYKLQGSSGTREFYRYYPVQIDTMISDLNTDDGEKIGHVMSSYQMSFSIKMEFFSTGFYYLFSDGLDKIRLPQTYPENSAIIPFFTDVVLKEDLNLRQGWNLYSQASCRLEKSDDEVSFDELLNNSIRNVEKHHIDNGVKPIEFMDIKIRKHGKLMKEGIEYKVDYEKNKIYFINQDTFHTYHIYICINTEFINDFIKDYYKLK